MQYCPEPFCSSAGMNQDDTAHTSLCRDICLQPRFHHHVMTEICAKQELNPTLFSATILNKHIGAHVTEMPFCMFGAYLNFCHVSYEQLLKRSISSSDTSITTKIKKIQETTAYSHFKGKSLLTPIKAY